MTKVANRLALAGLTILTILLSYSAPVRAENAVTFTIKVQSGFIRNEPNGLRIQSVFSGQVYTVTGRNSDNSWLRIDYPGVSSAWIMAVLGQVNGDLGSLPVVTTTSTSNTPLTVEPTPATETSAPTTLTTNAKITITARSTYARNAPSWTGLRVASLFKGQTYAVTGRTQDSNWVQMIYGGSPLWVWTGMGRLSQKLYTLPIVGGNMVNVPVTSSSTTITTPQNTTRPPLPAWIPVISQHMRQVYKQSSQFGNSSQAFAMVGDCNSEPFVYLERLAGGLFDLTPYGYLISTKDRFYTSMLRNSVAVQGSFGAASMFESIWSDPQQCRSGEGPYACELRVTRASIVFISLGTGDHLVWRDFEANYRKLIEYALKRSTLPVLVTKADILETQESDAPLYYINDVIRRLGKEYDVPVLDLQLATKDLPNHGLREEGGHDFHQSALAMDVHILTTLQTLDVIWR